MGLGPGNEEAAITFELSYLLFAPRCLFSPHFLCSSISVRWDICLFLPQHILPLPYELTPNLLINKVLKKKEKKKDTKCRMINLTRRNTPKRSQDVSIMCWIIPTPFGEWKKQKITLKFWTKSSLICFPLASSSQTSVSIRITHEGFYKNLLALSPEFQI